MNGNTLVEIKNLSRFYGALQAVKDVSFTIRQGAVLGFLFGFEALLRPQTHLIHAESLRVLLDSIVNFETFNYIFHGPPSIIWLPILYFFVWHYIIRWLNNLWGCECK